MSSRFLAVALVVIGVVLLIFGATAWQSISSEVSRAVSGTPNTKAIILLVFGVISLAAGGSMLFRM